MIRITPLFNSLRSSSCNAHCNLPKKRFIANCILQNECPHMCKFQNNRSLHSATPQLSTLVTSAQAHEKTDSKSFDELIKSGPSLKDFIVSDGIPVDANICAESIPYLPDINGCKQKVYFEVYGCQMNVNDAEVAWSVLKSHGYEKTNNLQQADIVLLITCSIRDKAEQKIWTMLRTISSLKSRRKMLSLPPIKVGLLGCMAERLKEKILERERIVDVIAGPDSYKDLPRLLSHADKETAINVILSFDETYADVMPVRLNPDSASAFVTIMRGCDNMCTYCIVPFTRGRERSRPIDSILKEVQHLSDQGIKEVTLLGQNVNSYRDLSESQFYPGSGTETRLVEGFKTVYKNKKGGLRFSALLDKVSLINPNMRIRFTSPHPKDFPDEVLQLIAERPNICKSLHVPAQCGNSAVLERMRRGYTREAYLDLIQHIREVLPDVHLTSDFIAGFCGETEEEFQDTLSLIELVKYNFAYLFAYSMREKTTAYRRYKDDVKQEVKIDRLKRMAALYRTEVEKLNKAQIGQLQLLLVEGFSKRSTQQLKGRNDGNLRVIIPSSSVPVGKDSDTKREINIGDYVVARITDANSEILKAVPLYHSSITEYASSCVTR